jgi:S1-C subfamily serine protease
MRSALLGLVLAACCAAVPAAAQKPPPLGAPGKPPPLGEAPGRAVGRATLGKPPPLPADPESGGGTLASSGSGFVAAPGRLLTNNHVVEGCLRLVARNAAGEDAAAPVLATDTRRDLAVLAVRDGFGPPLPFRDGPVVERGEGVVTYGFPLSELLSSGPTLTTGNVSALSGLRDNPREFEISAPVQPGNSGGPLLDMDGNVIGIVVAKLNAARVAEMTDGDIPQNVNFAVKGTEVLAFLRDQGISPRTVAGGALTRSAAEVGEVANLSTVFLRCYK